MIITSSFPLYSFSGRLSWLAVLWSGGRAEPTTPGKKTQDTEYKRGRVGVFSPFHDFGSAKRRETKNGKFEDPPYRRRSVIVKGRGFFLPPTLFWDSN